MSLQPVREDSEEEEEEEEIVERVQVARQQKDPNVVCCGKSFNKKLIVFASQFLLALAIVLFCLFELAMAIDKCDAQSFYGPILTMILGTYLPSPSLHGAHAGEADIPT